MMRICLFGGSFDPVHNGHITIAAAAQQAANLDRVVFLPAACSPFKTGQGAMYGAEARLHMLECATGQYPWAEVSELDLTLPPPSWSWRLAEHYHHQYPEADLYWLMGTDQWEQLHHWARYDYLTQHLTFIVYHRGAAPAPRPGVRSIFITGDHPAASSAIREALIQGREIPENWLTPELAALAKKHLPAALGSDTP